MGSVPDYLRRMREMAVGLKLEREVICARVRRELVDRSCRVETADTRCNPRGREVDLVAGLAGRSQLYRRASKFGLKTSNYRI